MKECMAEEKKKKEEESSVSEIIQDYMKDGKLEESMSGLAPQTIIIDMAQENSPLAPSPLENKSPFRVHTKPDSQLLQRSLGARDHAVRDLA